MVAKVISAMETDYEFIFAKARFLVAMGIDTTNVSCQRNELNVYICYNMIDGRYGNIAYCTILQFCLGLSRCENRIETASNTYQS